MSTTNLNFSSASCNLFVQRFIFNQRVFNLTYQMNIYILNNLI